MFNESPRWTVYVTAVGVAVGAGVAVAARVGMTVQVGKGV
jgi:hypothetical protein